MIEEFRKKQKKKKESRILLFPIIPQSQRKFNSQILSENALKLCRVGAKKTKFINFQLKCPDDSLQSTLRHVKIPMLSYKQNKFSYLREKTPKIPHSLLISRLKSLESLPSIGDYDTSNYQKIRFAQSKQCSFPTNEKQSRFLTKKQQNR